MAIVSMADAVAGAVASSAEYNKLIDNIEDLDARLGAFTSGSTALSRVTTLETRTLHASTGNTALGTRATNLETKVNNSAPLGSGNDVMNSRLTVLEASSGGTSPLFYGYQSSAQSVVYNTWTAIIFTQELIDNINGHSGGVNPSRYTPTVAGWYRCVGQVAFEANANGDRGAWFRKNGAGVAVPGAAYSGYRAGVAAVHGTALTEAFIQCNGSTDYIELFGYHSVSPGPLSTRVLAGSGADTTSWMNIQWVSA